MDWFGIAIIVILISCPVVLAVDVYRSLRKKHHRAPTRPPRARAIRATYGPGYHPVLNWDFDQACREWTPPSSMVITIMFNRTMRRVHHNQQTWGRAWERIIRTVMDMKPAMENLTFYQEVLSSSQRNELTVAPNPKED